MRSIWILAIGLVLTAASQRAFGQSEALAAKGAQLWSMTCNNCHNARSPVERTDRQWAVIVNHMRTRANLTKSEARAVTAFLQASNSSRRPENDDKTSAADRTGRVTPSGARRGPGSDYRSTVGPADTVAVRLSLEKMRDLFLYVEQK